MENLKDTKIAQEGTRSFDKTADKEMTEYTIETLFPCLNENCIYAEANYRRDTQVKGVDYVLMSEAGKEVYVDEKSQLHYLNNNSNTYSLEIGMLNKAGTHIEGWFIDEKNLTELYLFVFPNAEGKTYKDVKKEDFDKVDYLLVPKEAIKDYLEGRMLSIEKVLAIEDIARTIADESDLLTLKMELENLYPGIEIFELKDSRIKAEYEGATITEVFTKTGQRKIKAEANGVSMTLSLEGRNGEPMPEKPFNIILSRDIYEDLAILYLETSHGVITKEINKLDDYENLAENGRFEDLSVAEIARLSSKEVHCLDLILKFSSPSEKLEQNFKSAILKNGTMICSIEEPTEEILRLALGSYTKESFKTTPLEKLLVSAEKRIDTLIQNGIDKKFPMMKEKIGNRLKAKLESEVEKFTDNTEKALEVQKENEAQTERHSNIEENDIDDIE